MSATRRIVTIDCQYLHPEFAAAYLLIDSSDPARPEAAFIDNNTAHSVPLLLEALRAEGLTPAQVRYVIVTHVHLDHAGGTSQLMQACPKAELLAHPRATTHLVDPTKLVGSARKVYGAEAFDRLYGKIDAIPAARVSAIDDGGSVPFGRGAMLSFVHTRGHANHHFCIYEPETRSVFTGDAFGLAYPAMQRGREAFIFPSTSPTDFDGALAIQAIDLILGTGAECAYPTHFGAVRGLPAAAETLKTYLRSAQSWIAQASNQADAGLQNFFEAKIRAELVRLAWQAGMSLDASDWELLKLDVELNAQGLAHVVRKARNPSPSPKL